MSSLKGKKQSWKQHICLGLEAAHEKLSSYYGQTYRSHGVIYAVATILDPYQKLATFRSASWADDIEQWEEHYLEIMEKVFRHYRNRFPVVQEESYTPMKLSSLDKARNLSKRRRLSPASSDTQLTELQRYLDEIGEYHL